MPEGTLVMLHALTRSLGAPQHSAFSTLSLFQPSVFCVVSFFLLAFLTDGDTTDQPTTDYYADDAVDATAGSVSHLPHTTTTFLA